MADQYAPVPYRAAVLAKDDPNCIALIWYLYAQAHSTRWGWLRVSVRDLVRRWKAPKHRVEALLRELADEGLAERQVVQHGDRADGTRIRLFDPAPDTDRTRDRAREAGPDGVAGHDRDTDGGDEYRDGTTDTATDTATDTDRTRDRAREAGPDGVAGHDRDTATDTATDTTTDLTDRMHDRRDPPQPPAPRGELARARVDFVAETAYRELHGVPSANVGRKLDQWERGENTEVARITVMCRPRRNGDRFDAVYPDAPSGMTRRDVAEGLRAAARRWQSDHGPPHGE